jgi:outer membrane protein OmpA-like peptidoglycan-associated protein
MQKDFFEQWPAPSSPDSQDEARTPPAPELPFLDLPPAAPQPDIARDTPLVAGPEPEPTLEPDIEAPEYEPGEPAATDAVEPVTAPGTGTLSPEPGMEPDIFENDPFFKFDADPGTSSASGIPQIRATPPEPEPLPSPATAEERLLGTIVKEPSLAEPRPAVTRLAAEIATLKRQLEAATEDCAEAETARDKARRDLQGATTRVASLESELAAAREALTKEQRLRQQEATRHQDGERQTSEKLNHFKHMLDEVEDLRDEVAHKRVARPVVYGIIAAGLVATLGAYLLGAGSEGSGQEETPEIASTPAPPAPPALTLPAAPPATVPVPAPALKTPPVAKATAPALPALAGQRYKGTPVGDTLSVVFDYGVFDKGTDLAAGATEDLKAIAGRLKPLAGEFMLEVEGHTDPAKAVSAAARGNNQALGLARAKAVAAFLAKQGVPDSMMQVTSVGEAQPPHPNTTAGSRRKNRTVVLKVTPKAR